MGVQDDGHCLQRLAVRSYTYVKQAYWDLLASILEGLTLVLVVFFQDVAFKEIIVTCGCLVTVSFCLHGVAYKCGQCQVWPKVIEIAAPLLFYGLIPAAYLATQITYKTVFTVINYWFILWQSVFWLVLGRNFMYEYLCDWNPREVWDTPLIRHCATRVAISWITCEAIMGSIQIIVVVYNISLTTNTTAAIMLCYVMQLLPLLWAVIFTFAYPAYIKRKWGYVVGSRASCYPPPSCGSCHAVDSLSMSSSRTPLAAAGLTIISSSNAGKDCNVLDATDTLDDIERLQQ